MSLELKLLAFLRERIESMLESPAAWGGNEAVELQLLQLLELGELTLDGRSGSPSEMCTQPSYVSFLAKRFPGLPPETLSAILERTNRQSEFALILATFVRPRLEMIEKAYEDACVRDSTRNMIEIEVVRGVIRFAAESRQRSVPHRAVNLPQVSP